MVPAGVLPQVFVQAGQIAEHPDPRDSPPLDHEVRRSQPFDLSAGGRKSPEVTHVGPGKPHFREGGLVLGHTLEDLAPVIRQRRPDRGEVSPKLFGSAQLGAQRSPEADLLVQHLEQRAAVARVPETLVESGYQSRDAH